MSAIDPHRVGSSLDESKKEPRIVRGFTVERHQYAAASQVAGSKKSADVALENPLSFEKRALRQRLCLWTFLPCQRFEGNVNRFQSFQHASFCASERREPKRHQFALQSA
jgi:hypothetical protein